jgi:hypothetical protein
MTAREELFSVACDDMPVSGDEVNDAIDAYKRELLGVNPACGADYLRKRFAEAIWESDLVEFHKHADPEEVDVLVMALAERLLIEAGVT